MQARDRIKICAFICAAPALIIAARLFYLQTFRHMELADKTESRVYTQTTENTLRGRILDRNGVVLAESLPTYAVAVSKRNVNNRAALFAAFTGALGVSRQELNKLWQDKRNFFYVKKNVTPPEYEDLEKRVRAGRVTGVEVEPQYTRIYPFDNVAQDVLGATNSRNKGLSGIELMYNKILSQEQQSRRVKRARGGGIIYDNSHPGPAQTPDVYLTIDATGQYYTESILKKYALQHKVKSAFALVQESNTGEILAAASYPARDGRALPFQFSYEPGSTFKSIVVAAALDTGSIKVSDSIGMDDNKWAVDGIIIRDHQEKPKLSIGEILEVSSNIGTAKIAHALGARTMYSYAKKFGFGVKSNVAFLGEPGGILRDYPRWRPIDTAKAGYGYTISVTGVQLVGAYSAIANGGNLMQAHLIDKIVYPGGRETKLARPLKIRRVIEENTARQTASLLENVVEKGTGQNARVKGYRMAGKTGTSEKMSQEGRYERSLHIASFCGFAPAGAPRFTILVVLDEPERALFGAAAAAIFSEIAAKFLNIYSVPANKEI
ncbi:MAG: penicillin-binding protein 2 [Elusimicrobiota bacterium]|nr:penicillin-binding protein 2 [Elusimicrobiota bacterium]